jgi:capsular exopolysaccharide synthesis family protein
MDFADTLRTLRKGWAVIVVFVLTALVATGAYTLLQKPQFEATSQAFVSTESAGSVSDLSQSNSYLQQIVSSYAALATTPIVLDTVIDKLKLDTDPGELKQRVTASVPLDQVLIEITATDSDSARSAAIANEVTAELKKRVAQLAPTSTRNSATIRITQVEVAKPPTAPVSPRPALNLAAGGLAGLLLGIGVVLLARRLNTRIRDVSELEAVSGRPVLGSISVDPAARSQPLTVGPQATGRRAEEFRSLRTNLQFVHLTSDQRSFVVTSSIESEGKSSTSANLALALANLGQRVLIVDADLRRPKVANYFGIDGSIGLTDVLIGGTPLEDAVQSWEGADLSVLPAGQIPPNPNELLQSPPMAALISRLSEQYDVVVYDTPPLMPVSDAAVLARQTEGAIVLASAGRVHQSQLRGALAQLDAVKAVVLGVVLTMAPRPRSSSYEYAGSYKQEPVKRAPRGRKQPKGRLTSRAESDGRGMALGEDPA